MQTFVHVRGEIDFVTGEDPGPDLEFTQQAHAFASLARDTLSFLQSDVRSPEGDDGCGDAVPLSLAEMLWDPSSETLDGGVVRSPDGTERMLTWRMVEEMAAASDDASVGLLAIREDARKLIVETAIRKGERERTPREFFDLHRLLRPGDVVKYDGPTAAYKLVRVGDDVLGNRIRKLGPITQFKPDPLVMTHMFACVADAIACVARASGKGEIHMCFSLFQPKEEAGPSS